MVEHQCVNTTYFMAFVYVQEITCRHLHLMHVTYVLHAFNNELVVSLYRIYS